MRTLTITGFFIAACASVQAPASSVPGSITPSQAVAQAAAAPRQGVRGTFAMLVRATGSDHGHTFLNSELDYRDRHNLTIDIDVRGTKLLTRQLGSPPDRFYKGKWIEVHGTARRVPIRFFDDHGRPTGKYYFQTHVAVREPGQISVVPQPAAP